jgi:hypothetical protein
MVSEPGSLRLWPLGKRRWLLGKRRTANPVCAQPPLRSHDGAAGDEGLQIGAPVQTKPCKNLCHPQWRASYYRQPWGQPTASASRFCGVALNGEA